MKYYENKLSIAILSLCLLSFVPNLAYAQSSQEKAKAYFFAAETAFDRGDYQKALEKVRKAEAISGQTGPVLLMLETKSLFNLGRYKEAKATLNEFYNSNPSEVSKREMGTILIGIDENIEQASRLKAEQEALERRAEQEAARRAQEQRNAEAVRLAVIREKEEEARVLEQLRQEEESKLQKTLARQTYAKADTGIDFTSFKIAKPLGYPVDDAKNFKKKSKRCYREFKSKKGSNTDAVPCMRSVPIFPPEFLQGSNSGACKLNFDINESGHVENIIVLECSDPILSSAAEASVKKWYYMPAVVSEKIVKRRNVQSKVRFQLLGEDGNLLPYK